MAKKRGLGKPLEALLSYTESQLRRMTAPALLEEAPAKASDRLTTLSVRVIQAGKYQPRREMDPEALEALAQSIRSQGILQPLLVRSLPNKPHHYEIIAGERRFRAAQLANLNEVPVIIREVPDEAAVAIALIENIQRENLNPIEEGAALQRLIDEFGLTHEQTAEAVGKSRAAVTNLLRLLGLPDSIKSKVERGLMEMGHARCLVPLPEHMQLDLTNQIIAGQLSVRETEQIIKRIQNPKPDKMNVALDAEIARLATLLSTRLSLPVKIQGRARGRGKLIIQYKNRAQLDGLLNRLE